MSNSVEIGMSSRSRYEALAFLWLKGQDLSGKTPVEVLKMFENAYKEIHDSKLAKPKPHSF